MSDWLETQLAAQLGPVKAPDRLWERVAPRTSRPVRERDWSLWPVAAMVILTAAVGTLWLSSGGGRPAPDLRLLAREELRNAGPLDLVTQDPAEVRRWMREHVGVDVVLAPAATAHLRGVRVIRRGGMRIGEVAYQAAGFDATLLVARASGPGPTQHGLMSWKAHDQTYALAYADMGHAQAACLLCHTL